MASSAERLTDKQWAKIQPIFPKPTSMDRPWADNRKVLESILWVLRSESANLMLEHPELAERERRFL
jgi:transposase